MIRIAILLGLLGLAAATGIIAWSGYEQVLQALKAAGWGIVWSSLYHLVPMTCCVIGWRALLPARHKPSHGFFLYTLWLRSSVNNLMPVARIGGELVAVRVLIKRGVRKATSIAAMVVETTLSVIAVFLFDCVGISLFAFHVGASNLILRLFAGLLLSLPVIAALITVQRFGFFGILTKLVNVMFRDKWKKYAGDTARFDRAVHAMYRRRGRVIFCTFWQLMSWTLGAGEIWLPLHFLGHEVSLLEAVMLEALIQAAASVAFAVPGALGVQEAGFLLFGSMLGLTPEIAAALAMIRRCRDLLLYVPGLIAWQAQEGHWLLKKKA